MKQTGKVFLFIAVLSIVFFIFGCSDLKNPVETDNTNFEGQENSMLLKGKKGPKGSRASNHIARNAVDDIKLIGDDGSETVYEDAEDGLIDGWFIESPNEEAKIINTFDGDPGNRVIELIDNNTNSWFILGAGPWIPWYNRTQFTIKWSMKYCVDFEILVMVETGVTSNNFIFLSYTPGDDLGYLPKEPEYWGVPRIHHGLGDNIVDGEWRTFTQDLQQDLNEYMPNEETIQHVRYFKIRGRDDYTPPFCEDGQKPQMLTMQYTGEGKDESNHSQNPDKVYIWDNPDFTFPMINISPVYIVASDKDQPFQRNKVKVWFEDWVTLNGTFDINANNAVPLADRLNSNTYVSIFSSDPRVDSNSQILQTIKFHTSCSQPLNKDDQFGSLILVGGTMTTTGKGKGGTSGGKGKKDK